MSRSPTATDDDPIAALAAIEHAASFVASDTAQLLGGLQASLQSVRSSHPNTYGLHREWHVRIASRVADSLLLCGVACSSHMHPSTTWQSITTRHFTREKCSTRALQMVAVSYRSASCWTIEWQAWSNSPPSSLRSIGRSSRLKSRSVECQNDRAHQQRRRGAGGNASGGGGGGSASAKLFQMCYTRLPV